MVQLNVQLAVASAPIVCVCVQMVKSVPIMCVRRWQALLLEILGFEPGFVHWVEEVAGFFGEFNDLLLFEGVFDAVDVGGGLEVVVLQGLQGAEAFNSV